MIIRLLKENIFFIFKINIQTPEHIHSFLTHKHNYLKQ